jgi:hypothetical protein
MRLMETSWWLEGIVERNWQMTAEAAADSLCQE